MPPLHMLGMERQLLTLTLLSLLPLLAEKYARIEHENRLLLTKMSEIMTRPAAMDNVNNSWQFGHSLNRDRRAKELRRITEENLKILRRIQGVTPKYSHLEWEEDRIRQERLLDSIAEFKPPPRGSRDSLYTTRSRSLSPRGAAAAGYGGAMSGSGPLYADASAGHHVSDAALGGAGVGAGVRGGGSVASLSGAYTSGYDTATSFGALPARDASHRSLLAAGGASSLLPPSSLAPDYSSGGAVVTLPSYRDSAAAAAAASSGGEGLPRGPSMRASGSGAAAAAALGRAT